MTEVTIDVYKQSGKYYTGCTVSCESDIPLWDDRFKQFVVKNLPARYGNGYIVVKDTERSEGFHCVLYKYEELCTDA